MFDLRFASRRHSAAIASYKLRANIWNLRMVPRRLHPMTPTHVPAAQRPLFPVPPLEQKLPSDLGEAPRLANRPWIGDDLLDAQQRRHEHPVLQVRRAGGSAGERGRHAEELVQLAGWVAVDGVRTPSVFDILGDEIGFAAADDGNGDV